MQYYFPLQRKRHINGNLAAWMILCAPPTSASLFWFYYSPHHWIFGAKWYRSEALVTPTNLLLANQGFLYYTRTDFMPLAFLKIRPHYSNVFKHIIKNNHKCIELSEL